ncbi:gamma-glutamyl hydrolase isoform X2 [Oreochromis niloticus]|uniref:gamma-glutamyl hydrolase isoform X2 n=1 Tax=Oreochromis niloticus TaxID=8128 RepID=UPI000DF1480E|nr:gamma-glutamyl hydrolase isoform X2 [Oreochromis niloticus]
MPRTAAAVFAVLIACLWCSPALCAVGRTRQQLNYRPIIGVLAQENLPWDQFARGSSYIAASYVKYLEAAGARVVPIRINRTEEEYAKIFNSINGLLLPGGDVDLQTSQFSRAAKIFYNLALKANDAGDYFPIWGTCQGFQQLTVLTANKNLLTLTDTKAVALPLTLTSVAPSSRLFRNFPKDLLRSLANENITANFHSWSLSMQNHDAILELPLLCRWSLARSPHPSSAHLSSTISSVGLWKAPLAQLSFQRSFVVLAVAVESDLPMGPKQLDL